MDLQYQISQDRFNRVRAELALIYAELLGQYTPIITPTMYAERSRPINAIRDPAYLEYSTVKEVYKKKNLDQILRRMRDIDTQLMTLQSSMQLDCSLASEV